MSAYEFFNFDSEVWYRRGDGQSGQLLEGDREIIRFMWCKIIDYYPEAHKCLIKIHSNVSWNPSLLQYRVVRRFCKCNFGEIRQTPEDVDSRGMFHLEKVSCPLKGECRYENIICNPKFNSKISDSELRVLEEIYRGSSREEAADKLCLSIETVRNHINRSMGRHNFHRESELIAYCADHKLFNN